MYYHIVVDSNSEQKVRGKAENIDQLMSLLSNKEQRILFREDSFKTLENIFYKRIKSNETYLGYAGNFPINFISGGHIITTLVFYF